MSTQRISLVRRRARPLDIALVRPPGLVFPKSLSSTGPVPPIGLAYVAAALREGGHRVQVVDSVAEAPEATCDVATSVGTLRRIGLAPAEAVARIRGEPRMVGVTNLFLHEWPHVREILRAARARFPDALLVAGGDNATAYWPWMFEQCPELDAVVLGEGEQTALELAARLGDGEPLEGFAGLALRDRATGEVSTSGLPPRLRHIDQVPWPAWDLLSLEGYWSQGDVFGVERGRSLPMLATRGCPYRCSFCSSPQMWTTRYVVRDVTDVVDELEAYVRDLGVRNVDFADLTAIVKRSWTLDLCAELRRRDLDITWQLPVGTRSEALDEEVLQALWDTGCRNITYAPESGSERLLATWGKRLDLASLLASLATANRIGFVTHVNVIIGHPEETWRDVLATWRLLVATARAGCDTAAAIMFCPYPGSADFTALVEAGRFRPEGDDGWYVGLSRGSKGHRSFNPRIGARALRAVQLAMLLTFYGLGVALHPQRLLAYVRAQVTGREANHLDQLIRIKRRSVLGGGARRAA